MSTTGSMWRELPYNGQEFKKLSGVPHFLWGLGGDHQIYVYVHGLDIPIRIREEAYENEVSGDNVLEDLQSKTNFSALASYRRFHFKTPSH